MGKRKSSSKPAPKGKKDTLSTTFKCLFCNHEKSVSVNLDKKEHMFGKLRCKDCGQSFQAPISTAVDVYAEPMRNPDTLTNHGFAGGARMTMVGNEEDEDAEGEPEEDDDADSLNNFRPAKKQKEKRRSPVDDDDDDDEEDDAAASRRRKERIRQEKLKRMQKKPKARADDDDDDDESD